MHKISAHIDQPGNSAMQYTVDVDDFKLCMELENSASATVQLWQIGSLECG